MYRCATKNPPGWFECWVWSPSLGMSAPPWQRHRTVGVNWKCTMKTQPLLASTPFVYNQLSHDHIVLPFMTFWQFQLTPIAVMDRVFPSEMAVTTRADGSCTQFKTKQLCFYLQKVRYHIKAMMHLACVRTALHNSGIGVWRHDNSPYGLYPPISRVVKCHPAHAFSL